MVTPTNFQSKHYMVLPSSNFRSTSEINFMVNLSGVAVLENFKGNSDGNWHTEVVNIEDHRIEMDRVLTRVSSILPGLPPNRPDDSFASWVFVPLQWTVYASFNSIFNAGTSVNAGNEIDDWKLIRKTIVDPSTNLSIQKFDSIQVDLSVRDKDGQINKIAYEVNMHGYFGIQWNSQIE